MSGRAGKVDPQAVTILLAAGGVALSLLGMAWQIGRWQARAEERSRTLCQRLTDFVERVEADQLTTDKDIGGVHERVDDHRRDHSLPRPP